MNPRRAEADGIRALLERDGPSARAPASRHGPGARPAR
eukprot:CAMPEP_0119287608 /NCGR_PEP_ID=MMETSP1329-20130426/35874_1 /TAXON_ID=114041 /ORGANISM="Genus nov. species nov., Strain RCC1024" /LENGTH=37 /DNA_ID= /DNA_START= /DNA_END= /DNA_ORIENTATION=